MEGVCVRALRRAACLSLFPNGGSTSCAPRLDCKTPAAVQSGRDGSPVPTRGRGN